MSGSIVSQVARYAVSGGVVYAIDLAVFVLLNAVAPEHYLLTNLAGKLAGAFAGFFLHKYFTFAGPQAMQTRYQFIAYAALLGFNLALSAALLWALVDQMMAPTMPARIAVDIVIIMTSFLASRQIVYRQHSK